MAFQRKPAQAFETEPRPQIPMTKVTSKQVGWVGYDGLSRTLVPRFSQDDSGAIYHYPEVAPDGEAPSHAGMMAAESIGTYFGTHVKPRVFKKYPAEPAQAAEGS